MQTALKRKKVVDRRESRAKLVQARRIALLLLFLDIIGLFLSTILAYSLRLGGVGYWGDGLFVIFTSIVLTGLYLGDAYKPETRITGLSSVVRVIVSISFVVGTISSLIYIFDLETDPLTGRGIWIPSIAIFTIWAVVCRLMTSHLIQKNLRYRSWLVLSHRGLEQYISDFHKLDPQGKFSILSSRSGDESEKLSNTSVTHVDSIGNLDKYLPRIWSGVIVTDPEKLKYLETQALIRLRHCGTPVITQDKFYEEFAFKVPPGSLKDEWLAFGSGFDLFQDRFSKKLKRFIDVVSVSLLGFLTLPLMLIVSIAIKLDSPGKIFYSQIRTGLNKVPFRVYKFRSMITNSENGKAQWAQKNDSRITRVGYWLRILRIDELPQIWNVLKGEMSLIGPRPERPEFDCELENEIPYYSARYLVKPGITGWSQVMYGYGSSVEDSYEKVAYDLYYIKHFSLWLDFAIALKTVRIIFLGKGR